MEAEKVLLDFHNLLESRMESFGKLRDRSYQYQAVRRAYLDLRKMMRAAGVHVPLTPKQSRKNQHMTSKASPEMREAGAQVLLESDFRFSSREDVAEAIYNAMKITKQH